MDLRGGKNLVSVLDTEPSAEGGIDMRIRRKQLETEYLSLITYQCRCQPWDKV